jgi:NCS1 family nucleobase:cation symporter-1
MVNLFSLDIATITQANLICRTNIDCDVTPLERRTWTGWTMGGYWFSDALNAQSWEAPASIIAVGLTW